MNIVLIKTSGNQRYIFATNKLRENVGASELTYRAGTQTVLEAVEKITGKRIYDDDVNKLRRKLLDEATNPRIGNGNNVEVIVATSGKAILLVDDDENRTTSKQIIREVTQTAVQEMPGLTVHGAISKITFNTLDEKDDKGEFKLHKAIGDVHCRLEEIRFQMPSGEQRFLRLPFVAQCETSGLPASEATFLSEEEREKNEAHKFSKVTSAKRAVLRKYKSTYEKKDEDKLSRIVGMIQSLFNINLYENLELLEKDFKDLSWIAVIHADGNGLGEIFSNFNKHTGLNDGKCTPRDYVEKYRKFSLALDVCTVNAAGYALENLRRRFLAEEEEKARKQGKKITKSNRLIPVVPLIMGGDDLTILCDGQYALKFSQEFLKNFEEETTKDHFKEEGEEHGIIPQIAFNAFGVYKLGICAGVAIVKPHFPFHHGYELAESLLKSAKQVKEKIKSKSKREQYPCSALDYHILYDSTASRLEDIRDRMKSDNKQTWLYARPYVISDLNDEILDREIIEPNWCKKRRWNELESRVVAMLAKDEDDKRKLPSRRLHTLREALHLGKAESNAQVNLTRHRYNKTETEKVFDILLWDKDKENPSLLFDEVDEDKEYATHFIDALDIVEFRTGEEVIRIKDGEESHELRDKKSRDATIG